MKFRPIENAKSFWDISEEIASEVLLYTKGDMTPIPWDADITVDSDKVTLLGSIFGGSSNEYDAAGYCLCEISVAKFPQAYYIEIPDSVLSPEWIETLSENGWVRM